MSDAAEYCIVQVCCPTDVAEALAETVFAKRLAACAHILPEHRAIYQWGPENEICREPETTLLFKTRKTLYKELEKCIREHHPFECPLILAHPVLDGYPGYLQWVDQQTKDAA